MALGRAYIEIHADTKPFRRDLDEGVKSTLKDSTAGIGKAASQGINQGLKTFRFIPGTFQGILITGLAALIVGAAPLLASSFSALFTTAIGLAGIGTGIALAISDSPELQEAGKQLGITILSGLQNASTVFITPILQSIDILERRFQHILPGIESAFASLAPHVTTLATGLADFVSNMMPGLQNALHRAGPAIDEFALQLAGLGTTLSDVFDMLSDDPETTIQGLRTTFQLLNITLMGTAGVINILSEAWQVYLIVLDQVSQKLQFVSPLGIILQEGLEKLKGTTATLTPINNAYTRSLQAQGAGFQGAAVQGNALVETLREIYNVELGLSNATIALEQAEDDLRETFNKKNNTIDINTQKGRENVTLVNQWIAAAVREHEAAIAAGQGIAETNEIYQQRILELQKTLRAAGLTEDQILQLTAAYTKVPDSLTTRVTAPGLPGVLTQAQALERELREIHRQRIITIRAGMTGGIGGMAEGGVVTRPTMTWIGEAGAEAVVPLTDPARAQQVMAEAGLVSPMTVNIIVDGEVIERRVVRVTQSQARQVTSNPRSI